MTEITALSARAQPIQHSLRPPTSWPNPPLDLKTIEKRLPPLTGSSQFTKSCLVLKQLMQTRYEGLFSQIFPSGRVDAHRSPLKEARQKLDQFKQAILFPEGKNLQIELDAIPRDYREWLFWAVWVKEGCPDELQYGEKTTRRDLRILLTDVPWIFLTGDSLLDQLIGYIDQKMALKTQKQVVQTLGTIADRLRKLYFDRTLVVNIVEDLPLDLQNKISPSVWTKESQTILEEEKTKLEHLQTSAELEEFDRMTVLDRQLTPQQREALLEKCSPKIKKCFIELHATETGNLSSHYLYQRRGAHVQGKETTFCVFAPHAKTVTLVLTAFGREEHRLLMQKERDGTWTVSTDKAPPGRSYRYLVEDQHSNRVYRTDPFSFSTVDCGGWIESKVATSDHFLWEDSEWIKKRERTNPLKQPLSVYELYVESWKKREGKPISFRALTDALVDYCKKMHFSHIELYGVLDNEGGWGYQVHNFFAPNHRLGSAEDFKHLVNKLHQNGIGVILDWIPAHYKHEPQESTLHNFDGTDLFSSTRRSDWMTKLFDFSKKETRNLLKASLLYWLEEMHIDGVRVDAVSHIVKNYGEGCPPEGKENPEGIAFLKDLNQTVAKRFPGVLMIAEDLSGFPNMTLPTEQGGIGFHVKWGIYEGQKMRWFSQTPYSKRFLHHQDKFMDYLNTIGKEKKIITHSHDESANRKCGENYPLEEDQTLYKIDINSNLFEKFANMRNFFAWQVCTPSDGYLMHMGDEIGQRRSWDVGIWSPEGSIEWALLDPNKEKDSAYHLGLQTWISDLNRIYKEMPAFWKRGAQGFRLCCDHPANNVIAYERSEKNGHGVIVIHNFSNGTWSNYDIPLGKSDGLKGLEIILNSEDPKYGGKGNDNKKVKLTHTSNSAHITLNIPFLSTIVLEKII